MQAVEADTDWALVHHGRTRCRATAGRGAYRREDGLWVYRTVPARELWDLIMHSTYDHAEPGVLFVDRANADNNLAYCEPFEATNPCAEEWLPDYGCCCLGSHRPDALRDGPFETARRVRFRRLRPARPSRGADARQRAGSSPIWPLPQQRDEAMAKRRIGLGFTGLGDA